MVQVIQTENEIKIIIELNRLINKRPDVVLTSTYIKFNNPPIFFERHLTQEIDECASFCRIFKHEARIILIKKEKGLWPEIFQKLSKEEIFQKRLEITNQIIADNKKKDERTLERYEQQRRKEIEREVQRETDMRNRLQEFQQQACRSLFTEESNEAHIKNEAEHKSTKPSNVSAERESITSAKNMSRKDFRENSSIAPARSAVAAIRTTGKINVSFTKFLYSTPKRESQEGVPRPFIIENKIPEKTDRDVTEST